MKKSNPGKTTGWRAIGSSAAALALLSTLTASCGGGRPACRSLTCESAGATCGAISDGCGGTLDCGSCQMPSLLAAGDGWRLPGLPVEKLLIAGPSEMVALVEQHVVDSWNGRIDYVVDHPRRVVVLRRGATAPEEIAGALREDELLTDIAPGPESGLVWVAAVHWNAETSEIERRVALFAILPGQPGAALGEVASISLPPTHFEAYERAPTFMRYLPAEDTLDVLRIASRGGLLGVAGRNAAGMAYAERYTYSEGRLERKASIALTEPSRFIRIAMTGGTYDVLGWLGNRYRVHAALSESGALYAALVVKYRDLSGVDALFGSHFGGPVDPKRTSEIHALVLAIDDSGIVLPVEARRISTSELDGTLMAMLVSGERCLYGGLTRTAGPPSGKSEPTLFEVGRAARALTSTHASAALQTLAVDEAGRIWAGGSWGWSQNPSGQSIGGGERFVSLMPLQGEEWSESNILLPGQRRSEARAILLPSPGVICVGGMDDGPDTHAADGDASLVSGDGFVDCLAR